MNSCISNVLIGVRNPSTGNYLSLDQAIKSGIIDTKRGQYVDWKNNKAIPIPEAMSEGLIKVNKLEFYTI